MPDPASRRRRADRKSTRLNSSHLVISYAVFCLKKKKTSARPRTWREATSLSCRQSTMPLATRRTLTEPAPVSLYTTHCSLDHSSQHTWHPLVRSTARPLAEFEVQL